LLSLCLVNKRTRFLTFIFEIDKTIWISSFLDLIFHIWYLWINLVKHPIVNIFFIFINIILFIIHYIWRHIHKIEMLRNLIANFLLSIVNVNQLSARIYSSGRLCGVRDGLGSSQLPRWHSLLLWVVIVAVFNISSHCFPLFLVVIDTIVIAVGASYRLQVTFCAKRINAVLGVCCLIFSCSRMESAQREFVADLLRSQWWSI